MSGDWTSRIPLGSEEQQPRIETFLGLKAKPFKENLLAASLLGRLHRGLLGGLGCWSSRLGCRCGHRRCPGSWVGHHGHSLLERCSIGLHWCCIGLHWSSISLHRNSIGLLHWCRIGLLYWCCIGLHWCCIGLHWCCIGGGGWSRIGCRCSIGGCGRCSIGGGSCIGCSCTVGSAGKM